MSDEYTLEAGAAAATRMLRNEVGEEEILDLLGSELSKGQADQALTYARLRSQATDRFQDPWNLFFDEAGLRYATPDTVARARAQRLAPYGDTVLDAACGVGIQLAFLGLSFETAHGIEIDEERAELARMNQAALGSPATVHTGDCFEERFQETVGGVDVVVCDPARVPAAKERTFDGLAPDVHKVLDRWAQEAHAWCLELPPMMPPARVHADLEGELCYTSLDQDLNRLAVYGGEAAEVERSVLTLPTGERLTDQDDAAVLEPVEMAGDMVHLVDRTVLQADLLEQLAARAQAPALLSDEHPRRTLLTSDGPAETALTTDYEVLAGEAWNLQLLRGRMDRLDVGKVTLRASIDPEDYWTVRNALEDDLTGDRHVHLFNVGDQGIITLEIDA